MLERDKDILKSIAKKIDKDNISSSIIDDNDNNPGENFEESNKGFISSPDKIDNFLRRKRGLQNLEERKKLLDILKILFIIQLVFMNCIVLFIVVWIVFKSKIFNEINSELLKEILLFIKYYISAVLVELLGALVYVIHRVFSAKIY